MRYRWIAGLLCSSAICFAAHAAGLDEADLRWDLSYQAALRQAQLADNEFMRIWPQRYPTRQIHEALASYSGEPIEASVLMERPDGHTSDPHASWFVKTRNRATVCSYHPKVKTSCLTLEPAKAERLARELMAMAPLPPQREQKNVIGELEAGEPILVNYMGFVSIYVDGKALQRPVALTEWRDMAAPSGAATFGRVEDVLARATLSDADYAVRQDKINEAARSNAFDAAMQSGDVRTVARLLDQMPDRGAAVLNSGAALRIAAKSGSTAMVEFLLSKGAPLEPPADPQWPDKILGPTALGEAAAAGDEKMAAWLIRRGAKVNARTAPSVLAQASGTLNYALVDLLLKNGAIADNPISDQFETALMKAAQSARRNGRMGEAGPVVRRLVAAGANVNYLGRVCDTAYSLAVKYEDVELQRTLVELGADPGASKVCMDKLFSGRSGAQEGAEGKARAVISDETTRLLKARDYAGLEQLHARLQRDKVRTPAGAWGLSVFYATLRAYPQRTRDMAYWTREDAQGVQWAAKFPRSEVATVFQVYLRLARALAFRGNGKGADIPKDDVAQMQLAANQGVALLDQRARVAAARRTPLDGGFDEARLHILPYADRTEQHFSATWDWASKTYPDYHPLYFTAAFYSLPKWNGAPDAVERIARQAAAGNGAERQFMYARVYWYLDQMEYHGKIFENSMADWNDMKASFDALVQAYPDPWNLNAYAYFACKAGDYAVMTSVLQRIGEQLTFAQWGNSGEAEYMRCARYTPADARNFATELAARKQRMLEAQYTRLISYAIAKRERFRNDESLRALQVASEIEQQRWQRSGMRTNYHMALTLHNMGRYDDEVQALQRGLKAQPGYGSALFQMGLAYEGLRHKEEARAQFAVAAARLREELASDPRRTPEVQKELDRIRPKLAEYGISVPGL